MRITREWLFEHQTDAGSWTRDQLQAVGVKWPPLQGWIGRIVGNEINAATQARFEARRTVKQCRAELNALRAAQRADQ
jgi:hypothetical protein